MLVRGVRVFGTWPAFYLQEGAESLWVVPTMAKAAKVGGDYSKSFTLDFVYVGSLG